jgi:3-hydroxybutyryl-CoA dehydrogenase
VIGFVAAGHVVRVYEPGSASREDLRDRVRANLDALGAAEGAENLVSATGDLGEAVGEADYVTEAVPEKLSLKREVFAELVRLAPRDCILASNTSVIPIGRIAEGLETRDRIVGTHWWNPGHLIPLVEVVQAEGVSDAVVSRTMELLARVGKSPAHVLKDSPGFVGNRLQHALWREAIAMVAEGVCDAATIDNCVKNSFGLRLAVLGPLENADLVGTDLTLDIHEVVIPQLDRHAEPNAYLRELVQQGRLGFKTGRGFREWSPEQIAKVRTRLSDHLAKTSRGEDRP